MTRLHFSTALILAFSGLKLVACDSSDDEDKGTEDTADDAGGDDAGGDDAGDASAVQPQSGDWMILTTGWSDDQCNAAAVLSSITSVTFSDVTESTFTLTMYEGDVRIGNSVSCSHTGDDVFGCDAFYHEIVPFSNLDATFIMDGIPTVTLSSETEAAGKGELTLDCTGTDCSTALSQTGLTSFPCSTTNNWTAVP
jgi:hypothetical protein